MSGPSQWGQESLGDVGKELQVDCGGDRNMQQRKNLSGCSLEESGAATWSVRPLGVGSGELGDAGTDSGGDMFLWRR